MQINTPTKKQLNVFVLGLALILLFLSRKAYKTNNVNLSFLLIALIFLLLITYLIKREFVVKFYKVWMRAASLIGVVVTSLLMIAIFYLVFTPVGIFLRLIRKDILNLNKNPKLKSYWIDKPAKEFDKTNYENQY